MALEPGTYSRTVYCGATWERTLVWRINGTLVNWTGYNVAKLQVKQHLNSASVLTLTKDNGLTLGGSAGSIAITMTAAQTGAVTPGEYIYDLEVSNGTVTYRVLEGKLSFKGQVTI